MTGFRRLFGGAPEPPADIDARLIAELTAAGFNLAGPIPLEHTLVFRDERPARQVVALLAGLGGELRIGHSGRRWVVQLTLPMRVTPERIAALREQLAALAASHGGEYDGWSAPAR